MVKGPKVGGWKDRGCRYQAERVSAWWTPELVKLLCDTRHWPLARLTASCDPAFSEAKCDTRMVMIITLFPAARAGAASSSRPRHRVTTRPANQPSVKFSKSQRRHNFLNMKVFNQKKALVGASPWLWKLCRWFVCSSNLHTMYLSAGAAPHHRHRG